MSNFTAIAYYGGIPLSNKNPEKPAVLKHFIEGVKLCGDTGIDHHGNWLPSDVAVIQGYVHEQSPNTPHLIIRKNVIDSQKKTGKKTVIIDSNLFLYADPGNTKSYLRFSYDGVFPTTGNYCWDNPDPARWQKLKNNLKIDLQPWRKTGNNILICLQRNGGWSMKGQDNQLWALNVIQRIRQYSDRPIIIRGHPGDRHTKNYLDPSNKNFKLRGLTNVHFSDHLNTHILQDLKNAWATVVYNSSPSVASAINGVPVFVDDLADCQAKGVANTDFSKIENPEYFDQQPWVEKLAMCHWNFEELSTGECWRHMRKYV